MFHLVYVQLSVHFSVCQTLLNQQNFIILQHLEVK